MDTARVAAQIMAGLAGHGRLLSDIPGVAHAAGSYFADVSLDHIELPGTLYPVQKDRRTTALGLVAAASSCVLHQHLSVCDGECRLYSQLPL